MKDLYGRSIDYMRISITDRCNLRCKYCMPYGVEWVSSEDILTFEEIRTIASCGAELGIRYIKLTGGEPLVRKDCCALARMLKAIPGIEKVTITTNGVLLEKYLDALVQAGIDGINISLDTLDREKYRELTGFDCLDAVLRSVEKAAALPIPVKINAVSAAALTENAEDEAESEKNAGNAGNKERKRDQGTGSREGWREIAELARRYPVDVRFIEMMPIGYGKSFQAVNHQVLLEKMRQEFPGMQRDCRKHGFGPAVYYQIPGFQGSIGLINAIHGKFCSGCNRIRLTAQGYLKTCLCFSDGADLRAVLRESGQRRENVQGRKRGQGQECGQEQECGRDEARVRQKLTAVMEEAVKAKPKAHCFEVPERITEQHNMVDIGG